MHRYGAVGALGSLRGDKSTWKINEKIWSDTATISNVLFFYARKILPHNVIESHLKIKCASYPCL